MNRLKQCRELFRFRKDSLTKLQVIDYADIQFQPQVTPILIFLNIAIKYVNTPKYIFPLIVSFKSVRDLQKLSSMSAKSLSRPRSQRVTQCPRRQRLRGHTFFENIFMKITNFAKQLVLVRIWRLCTVEVYVVQKRDRQSRDTVPLRLGAKQLSQNVSTIRPF